jgi:hypothetical protein
MPVIRRVVLVTTANALTGLKFSVQPRPFLLSLYIASTTAGDSFGLSIGNTDVVVQGTTCNVIAAAGVIDTDRDQMLFRELCGAGEIFMPQTLTTSVLSLLVIEPLPVG